MRCVIALCFFALCSHQMGSCALCNQRPGPAQLDGRDMTLKQHQFRLWQSVKLQAVPTPVKV
eukprot:223078-Pleurochrysis_carterae.AAC.2